MQFKEVFILLLIILTAKADDDCEIDKSNLASVRLKKDLLCGYDKTLRPVRNHKDPVKVFMRMILKYFVYEPTDASFDVDSWMVLMWQDEHLKWDSSKYEQISQIHMSDSEIWIPDISIYNRRDQSGSPAAVREATCIVHNTSQVVCVPPTHQSSLCVADLTKYPFDTQNCTIRFGSWVHSGEELDIRLATPPVSIDDMVPNGEWEFVGHNVIKHPGKFKCCPNNTYPSINFSFKIRRLPGAHAATVFLPAIALTIITLISLWASPETSDRLYLCCVNVISQFLYLQYVSWMIPLHGHKIPLILLFAKDSLLLSAFTVVFSVILKNLVKNEKPAPAWISGTVAVLVSTKPGQFVFLNDNSIKVSTSGEDDETRIINNSQNVNPTSQEWITFVKILDVICFGIYVILYSVMLLAFIP